MKPNNEDQTTIERADTLLASPPVSPRIHSSNTSTSSKGNRTIPISFGIALAALGVIGVSNSCQQRPDKITQPTSFDAGSDAADAITGSRMTYLEAIPLVSSHDEFKLLLNAKDLRSGKSLRSSANAALDNAFKYNYNSYPLKLFYLTFASNGLDSWVLKEKLKEEDRRKDFHIIAGGYQNRALFEKAFMSFKIGSTSAGPIPLNILDFTEEQQRAIENNVAGLGLQILFVPDEDNEQRFYLYISKANQSESESKTAPRNISLMFDRKENGALKIDGLMQGLIVD